MQNQNENFNYYQYFNQNGYPYAPKDPLVNRDARHLTKLSLLAGLSVLGFVAVQNILLVLLSASGLVNDSMSFLQKSISSILLSFASVLIPFFAIYLFYNKDDKSSCLELGKPVCKKGFYLAISAGLMMCCFGDLISSGFSSFASIFGIEFSSYTTSIPSNALEFIIFVVECAVVPALVEEVAVRGIIMQPLRRYGDKFAIVMSSLVFALMHRNMVQIPFAFVVGIAIGYFVCATGSLWTGILIHFANNFYSVIITVLNEKTQYAGIIYYLLTTAIIVVGVYSCLSFVKTKHIGLELTFAPTSDKILLLASAAAFTFISFVFAVFSPSRPLVYIVNTVVLIICLARYIKSNAVMRSGNSGSLDTKLKLYLYCATPSIILAFISLIVSTLATLTVKSAIGYFVCYALLLSLLASAVYMIYKITSSNVLESKSVYHFSLAVLGAACFFGMIAIIAAKISLLAYIQ